MEELQALGSLRFAWISWHAGSKYGTGLYRWVDAAVTAGVMVNALKGSGHSGRMRRVPLPWAGPVAAMPGPAALAVVALSDGIYYYE